MHRIRAKTALATLVGLLLLSGAGVAGADQVHYLGMHPIPDAEVEAFCYIEVPHVHIYAPQHPKVLYRVENDMHHFVGDPVAFGYDGDTHPYYGHHPVQVNIDVDIVPAGYDDEYCYLDGPHFHHYAPPADARFVFKGNAYWYVGKFPRPYHRHKKVYVGINPVYHPLTYERPVVVVEARPPEYVGPVVGVAVAAPGASVRAGVDVHIPAPTLEIGISAGVAVPGLIVVDGPRHRHKRWRGKHKKFKKFKKHKKHKKHKRRGRWR